MSRVEMSDRASRGGDRYQDDNEQPVEGEFFDGEGRATIALP
jgi:hypothetical protein